MTGYHGIASLPEPFSGIAPDQHRAGIDAALFFCPSGGTPPTEAVCDETGNPDGDDGDQRLDDGSVKQGAKHPVGKFAPVDLVAMADEGLFPIKVDDGRTGMDLGCKGIGEIRPEVKIVVPLAIHDPCPRGLQSQEAFEDGPVVGKVPCRIADEEFEEVAEDDEEVSCAFQLGEKGEQRPVISVFGSAEVGIC